MALLALVRMKGIGTAGRFFTGRRCQVFRNYPEYMVKKDISETPQGELATERGLGWPAGTVACLREAFAAGRRRSEPWDFSGVPEGRKAALAQAAAVFRRGGMTVGEEPSIYRQAEVTGADSVARVIDDFMEKSIHRVFVVDEAVNARWTELRQLRTSFPVWILSGGEGAKNLETTSRLTEWIRAHGGTDRSSCQVAAIGGGVTIDLAGFAAGLLGLGHVNVPTTLLAMVDAAIGGKTGVNFPPYGKNQVGLFHFPEQVVICPEFLKTLPVDEVRSGAAECLKHAILARDLTLFDQWVLMARDGHGAVSGDLDSIVKIARMKEAFIEGDPFERSGDRELLNLGHTIAHALEAVAQGTGSAVRHGSAVAFGLACKTVLMASAHEDAVAVANRILGGLQASRCLDDIGRWVKNSRHDSDALWSSMVEQMRHDKKIRASDADAIRVVGLCWNAQAGRVGAESMQVKPGELRRAFQFCMDAIRSGRVPAV